MKRLRGYLFLILTLMIALSGCADKKEGSKKSDIEDKVETKADEDDTGKRPVKENIDIRSEFNGVNGCAVIYDPKENKYSYYNQNMSEQEVSPYSTFKIISTLIGMQNEVIESETSTINYNGTQYPNSEWNQNLTLQEAFQSSCIWYFRQIIDQVGKDEVEKELKALSYGNADVSQWNGSNINPFDDLNGFWLGSSLKISPLKQVQVLSEVFEGRSLYSKEAIDVLKNIMLVEDSDAQKIYGKTGTGPDGEGWFVGFGEREEANVYFAIYLEDQEQKETVTGSMAKEIALKVMR